MLFLFNFPLSFLYSQLNFIIYLIRGWAWVLTEPYFFSAQSKLHISQPSRKSIPTITNWKQSIFIHYDKINRKLIIIRKKKKLFYYLRMYLYATEGVVVLVLVGWQGIVVDVPNLIFISVRQFQLGVVV